MEESARAILILFLRRTGRTARNGLTGAAVRAVDRSLRRVSSRDALDWLYVALVLSVTGELAAIFAGKSVLVFLFFLATMFLCVVVWRWD
jgi:hypothetical protein